MDRSMSHFLVYNFVSVTNTVETIDSANKRNYSLLSLFCLHFLLAKYCRCVDTLAHTHAITHMLATIQHASCQNSAHNGCSIGQLKMWERLQCNSCWWHEREIYFIFAVTTRVSSRYVWQIENRMYQVLRTENTLTFDAMQINGNHHST